MSQYFPEPYGCPNVNIKVELDLSSYTTKTNLKGTTCIDTSTLASKTDLTGLKTKEDKTVKNP